MTDECLDIPTDVQGTVDELDVIETQTKPNEADDNPAAVPDEGQPTLDEGQPTLDEGQPTSALDQDAEAPTELDAADNPTATPEVTDSGNACVHVPTSAWSERAENGGDQQKTGNAQRDENVLDVDVQQTPRCESPTKSPIRTPEPFNPGSISVEISGKAGPENRDGDHVFSDYAHSPSPNYFRGKVNTPASAYTDPQDLVPYNDRRSMVGSELMYRRAATVAAGGYPSDQRLVRRTPLISLKTPPIGNYSPRYFYVEQKRPTPMQPLKVWRGYQGNVYFEPIHVNRANYLVPEPPPTPALDQYSDTLRQIMKRNKRKHSSPPRTITRQSAPRSETATATATATTPADENAPSRGGGSVVKGSRKMALLDQDAILDGDNDALREDIVWLVGMQSIGSLRIDETAEAKRGPSYQKHRICKGSVAHKIYALRNQEIPLLSLAKSADLSPKQPPTPRAPGASMQTSYNSFPELAVLRSRSRRPGQANREDFGAHDLISARPPPDDRVNFDEDGGLHFNARPFPGYGLRGRMRVSRTISPRRPQNRVF